MGHIQPEYLMAYADYIEWLRCGRPAGCDEYFAVEVPSQPQIDETSPIKPEVVLAENRNGKLLRGAAISRDLEPDIYNKVFKISWTCLFLEFLKVS